MIRIKVKDFFEIAEKSNNIICFGAGSLFKQALDFFKANKLVDKLSFCIDNSEAKQNTNITIDDKIIPIYSIESSIKNFTPNTLLIITCANIDEIILQLEKDVRFNSVKYICYRVIISIIKEQNALTKIIPQNLKISDNQLIPKKIHYCWFGGKPIPDKYKKWMESWYKYCPDYEIIEWNESNYDINKNKYMKQAYENKIWGFVPDYARLDIIYNHGGIYLDTDVELLSGFDDLLYQEGFACFESETNINLGLGFGALKGLEIIKKMLNVYDELDFVTENNTFNTVPSPIYQTEALVKLGLKLNGEYQIINGLTIFPEKMLCGKSLLTYKTKILPYSKSIHHYDGSWLDEKAKNHIRFYKEYIDCEI